MTDILKNLNLGNLQLLSAYKYHADHKILSVVAQVIFEHLNFNRNTAYTIVTRNTANILMADYETSERLDNFDVKSNFAKIYTKIQDKFLTNDVVIIELARELPPAEMLHFIVFDMITTRKEIRHISKWMRNIGVFEIQYYSAIFFECALVVDRIDRSVFLLLQEVGNFEQNGKLLYSSCVSLCHSLRNTFAYVELVEHLGDLAFENIKKQDPTKAEIEQQEKKQN